ncbi:hypothetical protein ACIQTZ_01170 [Paenarthrobacter sp. NPDC090520]|uniref:hypothetical protein n=1 Tax=Paenarthrobacter sp. NPDC090520 TaxID=3364382 RepID=UPI00380EF87E
MVVENVRRRLLALGAVATTGLLMAGCSVNVPDPAAPKPSPAGSTLSTPTITPGHDAAAVAAKDLPLAAGGTLVPGEPVTYASRLEEVPGWSVVHAGLQGENRYAKADGCVALARITVNQGPLVVPGDDVASTKALFQYLDAGIDPEKLKAATLRWGQDSEKPQRSVELLALESASTAGGKPATVMARLFSGTASSVYVSIACPDASALAKAKADVQAQVVIVPPS